MTQTELLYAYGGASTNLATFTSEDNLMKTYPSCQIPGSIFQNVGTRSTSLKIRACGQLGSTGTPTYILTLRLIAGDNPAWSAGGIILGASGTVTTASTVLLAPWQLDVDIVLRTLGAANGTHTVVTMGTISGAGFTNNGAIPANNVAPTLATVDPFATYSLFISATCSSSNSLNLINMQLLKVYGEN